MGDGLEHRTCTLAESTAWTDSRQSSVDMHAGSEMLASVRHHGTWPSCGRPYQGRTRHDEPSRSEERTARPVLDQLEVPRRSRLIQP